MSLSTLSSKADMCRRCMFDYIDRSTQLVLNLSAFQKDEHPSVFIP